MLTAWIMQLKGVENMKYCAFCYSNIAHPQPSIALRFGQHAAQAVRNPGWDDAVQLRAEAKGARLLPRLARRRSLGGQRADFHLQRECILGCLYIVIVCRTGQHGPMLSNCMNTAELGMHASTPTCRGLTAENGYWQLLRHLARAWGCILVRWAPANVVGASSCGTSQVPSNSRST
jgi:hypothetical protein